MPDQRARRDAGEERISVAASGTTNPESHGGYNAGMAIFSYIIGGILVWSLIGWGLDILLGTHWIVLAGAFLGLAGGFYLSFASRLRRSRSQSADSDGVDSRNAESGAVDSHRTVDSHRDQGPQPADSVEDPEQQ